MKYKVGDKTLLGEIVSIVMSVVDNRYYMIKDGNGDRLLLNESQVDKIVTVKQTSYEKPPIGLCPLNLWEDMRETEIRDAIIRYINASKPVPVEWITEYIERITKREIRVKNDPK